MDVTGFDSHFCPEIAHALEMQIDRARSDDTTARHRHLGFVESSHERS